MRQIGGGKARLGERLAGRFKSQVGGGFALGHYVALLDARARGDPLVRGIDERLEVGVGHDAFRRVMAEAPENEVGIHGR
jgi:hypothetical protein